MFKTVKDFYNLKSKIFGFLSANKHYFVFSILCSTLMFQNCSPVQFGQVVLPTEQPMGQFAARIQINSGDYFTTSSKVSVSIVAPEASEVYLTNDPNCLQGGQWQPVSPSKPWDLSQLNQEAFVYANFRATNAESGCVQASIVHDDIAPEIIYQNRPSGFINQIPLNFKFNARDEVSGLKERMFLNPNMSEKFCDRNSNGVLIQSLSGVKPVGAIYPDCDIRDDNAIDGTRSFSAVAWDQAGNRTEEVIIWTLDRVLPTVSVSSNQPVITSATNINFTFSGSDALSGISHFECSLDGAAWAICNANISFSGLSSSAHTLNYVSVDRATNRSAVGVYNWTVDLNVPTVTLRNPLPAAFSNQTTVSFIFDGVDSGVPLTQFRCSVDGGATEFVCSSGVSLNFTEGPKSFRVVGIDSVGNRSAPAIHNWTVDVTPPTVAIGLRPDLDTRSNVANFTLVVGADVSGIATLRCRIVNLNSAWTDCRSLSASFSSIPDGSHRFEVEAIDGATNSSGVIFYQWLKDSSLPILTVTPAQVMVTAVVGQPTLTRQPQVVFNLSATTARPRAIRFECKNPGDTVWRSCTTGVVMAAASENLYTGQFKAIDNIGNESLVQSYNWRVDLTGPNISYAVSPPAIASNAVAYQIQPTVVDQYANPTSCNFTLRRDAVLVNSGSCSSGAALNLGFMLLGNYTYSISASDLLGNISNSSYIWRVSNIGIPMNKTIIGGDNKLDILLVVDNSGSMDYERQSIKARLSSLFSNLSGLDWRLAMTTTDARTVDMTGVLERFSGTGIDSYYLDSLMNPDDRQAAFDLALDTMPRGGGAEQAVLASIRSIDRLNEGSKIRNKHDELVILLDGKLNNVMRNADFTFRNRVDEVDTVTLAAATPNIQNVFLPTYISNARNLSISSADSDDKALQSDLDNLTNYVNQIKTHRTNCAAMVAPIRSLHSTYFSPMISALQAFDAEVATAVTDLASFKAKITRLQTRVAAFKTATNNFYTPMSGYFNPADVACRAIDDRAPSILSILNFLRSKTMSPVDISPTMVSYINTILSQMQYAVATNGVPASGFTTEALNIGARAGGSTATLVQNMNQASVDISQTESLLAQASIWDPANDPALTFFRSDAAFSIIVVSDADETPDATTAITSPLALRPQKLITNIKQTLGNTKGFIFNAIIVPYPDLNACGAGTPENHNETPGQYYTQIVNLTGGIAGDVCAVDWGSQLGSISQRTAELTKQRFILNCIPMNIDGNAATIDVVVKENGTVKTTGFTIVGDTITFATPVPTGRTVTIDYSCPQ